MATVDDRDAIVAGLRAVRAKADAIEAERVRLIGEARRLGMGWDVIAIHLGMDPFDVQGRYG